MSDSIHIRNVSLGTTLRISLKAGYHLNPSVIRNTKRILTKETKRRVAKGYSYTVFLGRVISNDFVNGKLTLDVQDRTLRDIHYEASLDYVDILNAQVYLAGALGLQETAPATHPGTKALGTKTFGSYQLGSAKFLNVLF